MQTPLADGPGPNTVTRLPEKACLVGIPVSLLHASVRLEILKVYTGNLLTFRPLILKRLVLAQPDWQPALCLIPCLLASIYETST